MPVPDLCAIGQEKYRGLEWTYKTCSLHIGTFMILSSIADHGTIPVGLGCYLVCSLMVFQ